MIILLSRLVVLVLGVSAAFLFSIGAWAAKPIDFDWEVSQVLQKKFHSADYNEFLTSGQTPDELFAKVAKDPTLKSWAGLCNKFAAMGTLELLTFEPEITENHDDARFPCRTELLARARQYLEGQNTELNRLLANPAHSENPDPVLLPNIEKTVDAAEAPIYSSQSYMAQNGPMVPTTSPMETHGDLEENQIALTFDDGPHVERTQKILDTLASAGVHANFFEIGRNAKKYPDLSQAVVKAGHILGSHSMTHPILSTLPEARAEAEIIDGRDAVAGASGVMIPFFRYPGGGWTRPLVNFVKKQGLASFFWNMDTRDWEIHDPIQLYTHVIHEMDREKHGIILFHDVQPGTWVILPHVLREMAARKITTVMYVPKLN